jgi:hypothetical protein
MATRVEFLDLKETLREFCHRTNVPFDKLFSVFLIGGSMQSVLVET